MNTNVTRNTPVTHSQQKDERPKLYYIYQPVDGTLYRWYVRRVMRYANVRLGIAYVCDNGANFGYIPIYCVRLCSLSFCCVAASYHRTSALSLVHFLRLQID